MLISVKGNHERYLLNGLPKTIHDNKRRLSNEEIANHKWNHNKLKTLILMNVKKCLKKIDADIYLFIYLFIWSYSYLLY